MYPRTRAWNVLFSFSLALAHLFIHSATVACASDDIRAYRQLRLTVQSTDFNNNVKFTSPARSSGKRITRDTNGILDEGIGNARARNRSLMRSALNYLRRGVVRRVVVTVLANSVTNVYITSP